MQGLVLPRTLQARGRARALWAERGGAAAARAPTASRALYRGGARPAQGDQSAGRETLSVPHSLQPGGRAAERHGDRAASSRPSRLPGPRPVSSRPPGPLPWAACTTRPRAVTGHPDCVSTSCLSRRREPGTGAQRARLRAARARGSRRRRHFYREPRARCARRRACPAFPWRRGARPGGQEKGKGDQRALGGGNAKHPPSAPAAL